MWSQQDDHAAGACSASGGQAADLMLATARTFEKLLHDASQYGDTLHEALQKNDLTSAQGSWKQIRAGIKRINKLLVEMTEYASPAAPRLADVDVNRVMRETLDAFKDELRSARIQGRLDLQEKLEPRKLDEEILYKALLNLVENAYEALLGQGGTITLKSYETPQGALILEVIDNGPGLAPQTLTRAFQPFNAGPGSRGVGMGLAMTRRLLETMGGSATLSSEQGSGTTVTLIFAPTTRL
jgi:signal transduction histidine kinase